MKWQWPGGAHRLPEGRLEPRPRRNPWPAVFALLILVGGSYLPFAKRLLPESLCRLSEPLYILFLAGSFFLLRQPRATPGTLSVPTAAEDQRTSPRSSGWWVLDVLLCTYTFVPILQLALHLPRPHLSPISVFYGFPSGHTLVVFALAWLVYGAHPQWSGLWFSSAILLGWTRIQSMYHFPYQVVGGAVCGLALGEWILRHPGGVLAPLVRHALQRWRCGRLVALVNGPGRQSG